MKLVAVFILILSVSSVNAAKFYFATDSTDATLSNLKYNNITVPEFASDVYTYTVILPNGTTVVPIVSATTNDAKATAVITQAATVNGFATVVVTAQDTTTKLTYTVFFIVAPSSDATLSNIKVNNTAISGFTSGTFIYNVALPHGTTTIPNVTVTVHEPNATAVITQALSVTGYATITVTAQDGATKYTYTINFSIGPSADARLSDLKVDNITIPGFNPDTLTYNQIFPYGTTTIPNISATLNDSNATAVITQAPAVTGNAIVVVTAEDGTTKKTYIIHFIIAPSSNASLSDLKVNAITISGFTSSMLTYNVELPNGTTNIPIVSATAQEPKSTVVITQALSITGFATVVVTAQDGATRYTYTIHFTIAPSSNANLNDLKVNDTTISEFAPGTLTYYVELPYDVVNIPNVSAIVQDSNATVEITQAQSLTDSATVVVIAQDGSTKNTYIIYFSIGVSTQKLYNEQLKLTVYRNSLVIEPDETIADVMVTNINGKLVLKKTVNSSIAVINTEGWDSGIFVLTIKTKTRIFTKKIPIIK
jgi:hypothetical protein